MDKIWRVQNKKADFQAIGSTYQIDPVIARVIRNRGIVGDEEIRSYLYGDISMLYDPLSLKDMDAAVSFLEADIACGRHIRIVGDYDIDGVMSTYILMTALTYLGANVDYRIPHRVKDGYGVNTRIIEEAHEAGVDTILTCDNGVSAHEAVMLAKSFGMTVIVTDHHEIGELVAADAVVNPHRKDDTSKNKNLCGAAVAWKLVLALDADPNYELLPFAAFATIGDVMDLVGENRILVKEGLKRMRETTHIGLLALAKATELDLSVLDTYHIGFVLGPCINAAGRLAEADIALKLLLSDSPTEAEGLASRLVSLNNERKVLTDQGVENATKLLEDTGLVADKVLVVYLPDLHESVAGIVAGRLREKYYRPVFVLTGHGTVKGSGRSIESYSMFRELQKVSDCLLRFGGHPLAAGLSLEERNIGLFRMMLNRNCSLSDKDLMPTVMIDVPMPVWAVSRTIIDQLSLLAPFGKGNEKPLFGDPHVYIHSMSYMGKEKHFVRAELQSLVKTQGGLGLYGQKLNSVYFEDGTELFEKGNKTKHIGIAYEPQINSYRGQESVQLVIKDWKLP